MAKRPKRVIIEVPPFKERGSIIFIMPELKAPREPQRYTVLLAMQTRAPGLGIVVLHCQSKLTIGEARKTAKIFQEA